MWINWCSTLLFVDDIRVNEGNHVLLLVTRHNYTEYTSSQFGIELALTLITFIRKVWRYQNE